MLNFLSGGAKLARGVAKIAFGPPVKVALEEPDPIRRLVLTGAISAIAVGALAVSFPTDALAEEHGRRRSRERDDDNNDDDDNDHGRRRSRDDHSRRRSRNQHSRRRSSDHGRRRSRREFNDWNEDCALTPFGWICF